MVKTKMVSMRYTEKMMKQVDKAAYLKGVTMKEVVALGIELVYKEALKNEKKE